jgi:hydrogenase maturation protein HypF
MHVVNGRGRFIRRSRGYVPVPINLPYNADGVLAVGAELVNSFCVGKYSQAIMSQHVGDLKNLETYEFFTESIERYKELFRVEPKLIVTDLHPEYLSTTFALSTGLPIMQVQHHHAHIASCMAEHGLVEKVIGIAFDGVGLGDDGNIWGGEFMICDLSAYERITYFDYQAMPGGDQATLNPWRMAVSYLHSIYGKDFTRLKLPFLNEIDPKTVEIVIEMIEKNVNSPLTSSVGRIFDAVSALTGLCIKSTFHAEAPMRLESVIEKDSLEYYTYQINKTISVRPVIQEIVNDLLNSVSVSRISTRFHNTIVRIVVEISEKLRKTYSINKVVLSGGTFQNKYILRRLEENLKTRDFEVYINEKVPSNDGGISLGQLAIAANRNY